MCDHITGSIRIHYLTTKHLIRIDKGRNIIRRLVKKKRVEEETQV